MLENLNVIPLSISLFLSLSKSNKNRKKVNTKKKWIGKLFGSSIQRGPGGFRMWAHTAQRTPVHWHVCGWRCIWPERHAINLTPNNVYKVSCPCPSPYSSNRFERIKINRTRWTEGTCSLDHVRIRIDGHKGGAEEADGKSINQMNHIIYTLALRLSFAWNDLNIFMSKRFILRVAESNHEKCSRETCVHQGDETTFMFRSVSFPHRINVSCVCSTTFNPTKSASSHVQSVTLHRTKSPYLNRNDIFRVLLSLSLSLFHSFLCRSLLAGDWCRRWPLVRFADARDLWTQI